MRAAFVLAALVASAPSPLQDGLAAAMNELHETEQATIAESLDRIVATMEVRHIDAGPILETGSVGLTNGEANPVELLGLPLSGG